MSYLNFSLHEARTAAALFERIFPADEVPGAVEIGVVDYVDRALAGAYRDQRASVLAGAGGIGPRRRGRNRLCLRRRHARSTGRAAASHGTR
ncbi:MAG: gluconate 2-dehydrogenase subunit 3 family protein [Caldilineaceae bacterium]